MDKDIKIRKIRIEDADDVVRLEESNFSAPWKKADFEDLIDKDDRGCVVAQLSRDPCGEAGNGPNPYSGGEAGNGSDRDPGGEAGDKIHGRIIGCVVYRNIVGDVDITNVQVDTAFRRQGIARELMVKAMEYARACGGVRFTLEVRASNAPAIALYESLGFVSAGVRPGFYEDPREDAVIMWKYT